MLGISVLEYILLYVSVQEYLALEYFLFQGISWPSNGCNIPHTVGHFWDVNHFLWVPPPLTINKQLELEINKQILFTAHKKSSLNKPRALFNRNTGKLKNSVLAHMIYILLGICRLVAKITRTLMSTLVIGHEVRWAQSYTFTRSVTYICGIYLWVIFVAYICDIYLWHIFVVKYNLSTIWRPMWHIFGPVANLPRSNCGWS